MANLEKITENYQAILAFNQKALEVSNQYEKISKKIKTTGHYHQDYLLASELFQLNAKINYNHENKGIIFDKAEIYYDLETYPELYYLGFSLILLLKSKGLSYHLKIASTQIDQFSFAPVIINRHIMIIAQEGNELRNGIIIKFSSRQDITNITNFCNKTIDDFNKTINKQSRLAKHPNL